MVTWLFLNFSCTNSLSVIGLLCQILILFGPLEPLLPRPRGRMGTDQVTGEMADISTSQTKARIVVESAGRQVTGRIRKAPLDHKLDLSEPVQRRK